MSALVIKSDSDSNIRILKELAEKLGASVIHVDDDQVEDFFLGRLMDSSKTGTLVDRSIIFSKLNRNK